MKISKQQLQQMIREEILSETGHTDVPSTRSDLITIVEDCDDLLRLLAEMPEHVSLPTWWTNKIAIASSYLNSCRDYLLTSGGNNEDN